MDPACSGVCYCNQPRPAPGARRGEPHSICHALVHETAASSRDRFKHMPGKNFTRAEAQVRAAIVENSEYEVELDLTTGLTDKTPTFRSTTHVRFAAEKGAETFIDLIAPRVISITLNGTELDPATHYADSRIALPGLQHSNELEPSRIYRSSRLSLAALR